jgi:hypothetical protein
MSNEQTKTKEQLRVELKDLIKQVIPLVKQLMAIRKSEKEGGK